MIALPIEGDNIGIIIDPERYGPQDIKPIEAKNCFMQKKDTICVDLELGEGPIPQRLNFVACMIANPLTQTGEGTVDDRKKVDGVMKVLVPTEEFKKINEIIFK